MTVDAAGNRTYSGTRYGANETIDALESLNLYAKWDVRDDSERTCTMTYKLDGGAYKGSSAEVTSTVPYGKAITVEPIIPAREGYSFRGWYLDGMYYRNDLPVTKDLTLTAKWEKIVLAPGQHYAMLIAYTGDEIGVLLTDKDGLLAPQASGSRAEAAKMLMSFLGA